MMLTDIVKTFVQEDFSTMLYIESNEILICRGCMTIRVGTFSSTGNN
jgi:hypothetical protein